MAFSTAFQANAFQSNAFQIAGAPPVFQPDMHDGIDGARREREFDEARQTRERVKRERRDELTNLIKAARDEVETGRPRKPPVVELPVALPPVLLAPAKTFLDLAPLHAALQQQADDDLAVVLLMAA
jgi:hypothetical protein